MLSGYLFRGSILDDDWLHFDLQRFHPLLVLRVQVLPEGGAHLLQGPGLLLLLAQLLLPHVRQLKLEQKETVTSSKALFRSCLKRAATQITRTAIVLY